MYVRKTIRNGPALVFGSQLDFLKQLSAHLLERPRTSANHRTDLTELSQRRALCTNYVCRNGTSPPLIGSRGQLVKDNLVFTGKSAELRHAISSQNVPKGLPATGFSDRMIYSVYLPEFQISLW
jgi:hypothetical protein